MASQQDSGSCHHGRGAGAGKHHLLEQDFFFRGKNYCAESLGCHQGSLLSGVESTPYSRPRLYSLLPGSELL